MLSLKTERLKRYKDIALLLNKYGRSDLVKQAGLEEHIDLDQEAAGETGPEAEELAADLERLGPAFIKLGQLLSTRADLLPPAYLQALGRLQDRVEPFPFTDVERIVEDELGVRLSKGFAWFDVTPIAAAALGQVPRAALRAGRVVAVKVQRPGGRERVAEDLLAMDDIAGFLDNHTNAGRYVGFGEMVREFRRTLAQELDYRRE